tara:strand:- start:1343 stop:1579 length:237 start_codon:yes stop_codon:yes gene_type:complete
MKTLLYLLIFILTIVPAANAYPENKMKDCMRRALNNPATELISEESIKDYCDCALKAIIDEKKDIRDSGYDCALKNFK